MCLAHDQRSAPGSLLARIALTLCLLMALVGGLFAMTGRGTVQGTAVDAQGLPLAGVELLITCSCDLTYKGRTTTDRKGYYSISRVPTGGGVNVVVFVGGVVVARGGGVLMQDGENVTIDVYPPSSARKPER